MSSPPARFLLQHFSLCFPAPAQDPTAPLLPVSCRSKLRCSGSGRPVLPNGSVRWAGRRRGRARRRRTGGTSVGIQLERRKLPERRRSKAGCRAEPKEADATNRLTFTAHVLTLLNCQHPLQLWDGGTVSRHSWGRQSPGLSRRPGTTELIRSDHHGGRIGPTGPKVPAGPVPRRAANASRCRTNRPSRLLRFPQTCVRAPEGDSRLETVCSRLEVGLRRLQPVRGRRPERVVEVLLRTPAQPATPRTQSCGTDPEPRAVGLTQSGKIGGREELQ